MQSLKIDRFHLDVMDNHYVDNLSYGPSFLKAIRPVIREPIDVHLMISPVDEMARKFIDLGADSICFHPNACMNSYKTLKLIKDASVKVGIVLNPLESPSVYKHLLQECDYALVMSVNPGHGGQSFIEGSLKTLEELKSINPLLERHIDGGINEKTALLAKQAGAQVLIAGSALFNPTLQQKLFHVLGRQS